MRLWPLSAAIMCSRMCRGNICVTASQGGERQLSVIASRIGRKVVLSCNWKESEREGKPYRAVPRSMQEGGRDDGVRCMRGGYGVVWWRMTTIMVFQWPTQITHNSNPACRHLLEHAQLRLVHLRHASIALRSGGDVGLNQQQHLQGSGDGWTVRLLTYMGEERGRHAADQHHRATSWDIITGASILRTPSDAK